MLEIVLVALLGVEALSFLAVMTVFVLSIREKQRRVQREEQRAILDSQERLDRIREKLREARDGNPQE